MYKYIIIVNNKDSYFFPSIKRDDLKVYSLYKSKLSFFMKKIVKILPVRFLLFFCSDWKLWLNDNSKTIIIFDECRVNFNLLKVFKNKRCKKILYYWNIIIEKDEKYLRNQKKVFDIFSFDENDSMKFSLKFNHQFVAIVDKQNSDKNKYFFSFIGQDKGRVKKYINFLSKIQNKYFSFIKFVNFDDDFDKNKYSDMYLPIGLSYVENVDIENSSICIIDIVRDGQSGYTLRTLESIIYQKKLLTNNASIVNEKFYNKNNIFIFNSETTLDEINSFLGLTFVEYNQDIIDEFLVNSWIKRF